MAPQAHEFRLQHKSQLSVQIRYRVTQIP
jgi:hypothetical protein